MIANGMKISFVIPAYNEEKRLGPCLDSIQNALAAGHYDAEIIVVNNASTDGTAKVAAAYPGVRVVNEPRKGLTRARQAGFKAATGDIIANVDADTMLPAEWLPTVMHAFERNEKLVGLSGPFVYTDLPLLHRVAVRFLFYGVGYIAYLINKHVLRVGTMLQGGNYVVRRSALEKIGGYDTSIEFYGEDIDIARRLYPMGDIVWTFRLPMYTSGRRIAHEGLITMGLKYGINYLWTIFAGKPFTSTYIDVRSQ